MNDLTLCQVQALPVLGQGRATGVLGPVLFNWFHKRVISSFHLARFNVLLDFGKIDPVHGWLTDDQTDENFFLEKESTPHLQFSFEEDFGGGCRFFGHVLCDEALGEDLTQLARVDVLS